MTTFWLIVFVLSPNGLIAEMHEMSSMRACRQEHRQMMELNPGVAIWAKCEERRTT